MRHCTILIGSTGGGKSVIINTLVKAQHEMGLQTKLIVLNPKVKCKFCDPDKGLNNLPHSHAIECIYRIHSNSKACSVAELYGYLDSDTDDWMDGLFANIFRDMNRPVDVEVSKLNPTYFKFFARL